MRKDSILVGMELKILPEILKTIPNSTFYPADLENVTGSH